jgi:regulator of replication initiation timing
MFGGGKKPVNKHGRSRKKARIEQQQAAGGTATSEATPSRKSISFFTMNLCAHFVAQINHTYLTSIVFVSSKSRNQATASSLRRTLRTAEAKIDGFQKRLLILKQENAELKTENARLKKENATLASAKTQQAQKLAKAQAAKRHFKHQLSKIKQRGHEQWKRLSSTSCLECSVK